ncbi:MAG: hypothetical protein J6B92_07305 [Paraprevotella sp.]|nr:hypothetical protein [Paraprevotella sp.]
MEKTVAITIPIYKEEITNDEEMSLRQCFNILKTYDIYLVCPSSLNISQYEKCIEMEINTVRFKDEFFDGISGYNELMKSNIFYKTFKQYKYILIYQLDAWVFYDSLTEWCNKNYDYIGAPWFENHGTHENGNRLWTVGNGGFSLRKVKTFIKITNQHNIARYPNAVFRKYYHSPKDFFKSAFHCLVRNDMKHYKKEKHYLWEDTFFCYGLQDCRFKLRIPSPQEALKFSFECSPKFLFNLNGRNLPFGCHAWRKYQYEDFWKKYIH